MIEKFKQLNDQMSRNDEKIDSTHQRIAQLEKENAQLRGKVNSLTTEV